MGRVFPIKKLEGKTIQSVEVVRAEYGRTYNWYTHFVCTDGTKIMVYDGCEAPYSPKITPEEMREAPNYYSPDDIADRVKELEVEKRNRIKEERETKIRAYNRLKEELRIDT